MNIRGICTAKKNRFTSGFTIVELLIIVVIIGVLAAIVTVAYNGIQQRAGVAVLESDLTNAASSIASYEVINGSYPSNSADANDGQGLKSSDGTVFEYTGTGSSYCLTASSDRAKTSLYVNNVIGNSAEGVCPGHIGYAGGGSSGSVVTTIAGSGESGYENGTGANASFDTPEGIAVDSSGNIYVADSVNSSIRKITPSGVVSTLAGSGIAGYVDDTGTSAEFYYPSGVDVDSSGNVYVADNFNHCIRKITPAGVVTTLAGSGESGYADGTGTDAEFASPYDIAVDASGNVFVADNGNNRIRKITPSGVTTTIAGSGEWGVLDGTGVDAEMAGSFGITIDGSNNLYVADGNGTVLRKVASDGEVTSIAGDIGGGFGYGYDDGVGSEAMFGHLNDLVFDSTSGNLYAADENRVRQITLGGEVTTIAGDVSSGYVDGLAVNAQFSGAVGIAVDSAGDLYIADSNNFRIRKLTR